MNREYAAMYQEGHDRLAQSIKISSAQPQDADAIMRLKRDAWLAAYPNETHGVTIDDIERKFPLDSLPAAIHNWEQGIAAEAESDQRATFVARIDGTVCGYTSPCIEDGQRRIGAMYVAPGAQGKGIGAKLMERALEWHGSDEDVYLHVVSYNEKAIRFYEKCGFQKTGVEFPESFYEEQGIKLLPEIEMVRKQAP